MEGRKRREWSSDSFSGSAKEIKRVVQKKPRPSQTTKTTKSAETDKKEKSQSQTGTGSFPSKYPPSRLFKPFQRFYLGQEMPAPNPDFLRAITEKPDKPILDSGKENPPSKPERSPKRKFTFSKNLPRQGKSYDGSSVKRPRATVENFESGKSPSNPEFPPVLRGICPEASIGIVQEQPASKPEPSRVRKGRSKIPILASGQEQPSSKPEHSRVRKGRSKIPKIASGQEKYPSKPELVMKRTLPFPKYLPRQEKSSYDGSPVKRPRMTAKRFESGKSPSRREFSPVVRGKSKIPHLSSGQQQLHHQSLSVHVEHYDEQSKRPNLKGTFLNQPVVSDLSTGFRVPLWPHVQKRDLFETLPSGEVKCRVDKGTEEDKFGLIQIAKKAARRNQMKKKKVQPVKNTPFVDIRTGETVHALLHRPFDSLQWPVTPNKLERPPYILTKSLRSEPTFFGFLDISPFSIKETQYSPHHNIHFVLMKGHLEVVIQNTTFTFKAKDSWIVPMGVPYSLKNCSRSKTNKFSFTAFKHHFFHNQFAD
ncbi:CENP-C_C domain-containing protein [Trichonephila inaurata madagascariensis]|uniref:CENP-C_C domain-containing protein n=1 Tax=Trichonephila inaurata madagascariensis TaxID=2747483 RepID=A0A8X6YC30_9ARAC|nr:CENP-C_C domain-containing protein [Trichonephila inaurata madagascariensis]